MHLHIYLTHTHALYAYTHGEGVVGMFDIASTGCTGKGTSMSGLRSEVADVLQILL